MSGEKDVTVNVVDPRLLAEAEAVRRQLERQRAQVDEACRAASSRLNTAQARVAKARATSSEITAQAGRIEQQLEDVAMERRVLLQRLKSMKKETRDAQREGAELLDRTEGLCHDIESQLASLGDLRRRLEDELNESRRLQAEHDGTEAAEAAAQLTAATDEHTSLLARQGELQAQISAFAADAATGVVIREMLAASADLNYAVARVFATDDEVELVFTSQQKETIRVAVALSKQKAEKLTDDPKLQLILHGAGHDDRDSCIIETVRLLERLRERGVQVTLRVGAPGGHSPAGRSATGVGERERG